MVKPYYQDDAVTLYHGDSRAVLPLLSRPFAMPCAMVTDPPYGVAYESGKAGALPRSIAGDDDTTYRDEVLALWGDRPALVFGTWKRAKPTGTKMVLVWDTKGALGMGDLSLPWKPAHQEIYVIPGDLPGSSPFVGTRGSDVLRFAPVQSMAANGRVHPHEKPIALMRALVRACAADCILDPFAGSGSTLVAAKSEGRQAIGIELDERYCAVAATRLSQNVLDLGASA